jgi:hypothetical protein
VVNNTSRPPPPGLIAYAGEQCAFIIQDRLRLRRQAVVTNPSFAHRRAPRAAGPEIAGLSRTSSAVTAGSPCSRSSAQLSLLRAEGHSRPGDVQAALLAPARVGSPERLTGQEEPGRGAARGPAGKPLGGGGWQKASLEQHAATRSKRARRSGSAEQGGRYCTRRQEAEGPRAWVGNEVIHPRSPQAWTSPDEAKREAGEPEGDRDGPSGRYRMLISRS